MIIPDDKSSPAAMENNDSDTSTLASGHELPPPPYAGLQDDRSAPASESNPNAGVRTDAPIYPRSRPAPPIPSSNFVVIKRTVDGITGSYVVDTQLRVPKIVSFCGAEGSEGANDESGLISGERPHLHLESTHGSIHADIWLVRGRGNSQLGQEVKSIRDDRALINVTTGHSVINTRLRCETEQPYILRCTSSHGAINVWLPPNFVGPVTISTVHGNVFFSPSVRSWCTTFSEVDNVRSCFIGDYEVAGFRSLNSWKGSILQLSTSTSSIRINSIEELSSESSNKEWPAQSWWNPFSWR
ncbi:hypothetical protein SCHPADRAFT_1002397 [Schizopora paradoxa]|uniref:DUF7330 domain-containing protein n=1 Tax=Schizopora paradoxa TaxID=27342 RepID=A0A0H2R3F9_9AGAM|nr:hypothetical protein SCHPADRAFT_1002397 [Schizopora paradoxa]